MSGQEAGNERILIAGPASAPLSGSLRVPGDKSISHRAVMLASLADGVTEIEGFLPGEDNLATCAMFEAMGVAIRWKDESRTRLAVEGRGLFGLEEPERPLDAGNSGTCARLMTGVLSGQSFFSVLIGDASLHRRPMRRVVEPMRRMGAHVDGRAGGDKLPLAIRGGKLKAIRHAPEVASAQVKSCVLLAGLYAEGTTEVIEPRPTRDHTERMLPRFGQPVEVGENGAIRLSPAGRLAAPDDTLRIPADPSSACFFAVAASIVPDSRIRLEQVGINPRRDGWRRILATMGAQLDVMPLEEGGLEPVADIEVRSGRLANLSVDPADVP
ncbi:MAG: 3-phosphoshikimate 1-carboxyvinyltransferase, partial [Deltaproteobacteria bacterium]